MYRLIGCCLILAAAFAAYGQEINLTGSIKNNDGKPVKNAVVTLLGKKLKATSDGNGQYEIRNDIVSVDPIFMKPQSEEILLQQGIVKFGIKEASHLKIELYDVNGALQENIVRQSISAGVYQFDIRGKMQTTQMSIVRVYVGQRAATFRYLKLHSGKSVVYSTARSILTGNGRLAKMLAKTVDSLKVDADGYEIKVVPIASFNEKVDIVLDEIITNLPHFSFFVTSMKGLQELSKSNDGFGGDLRFGFTGPGAGLKGADRICECLAEMSMPGSKVKKWRAFLSVSKDENGKKVNAIDRIGKGPWYDREGRLLAPTLADLKNARPENGDPEIKNDLPNEWGIPNHRPDPTKGDVDNHHMITGSTEDGTLYSANATCDDWTDVDASGKPRCGFSWPRGSGGRGGSKGSHWISGFNAGGCEAGIHVKDDGGGPRGATIIGSGGGYGGFYCFALKP